MKALFLFLAVVATSANGLSQGVKISDTPGTPDPAAMFEIETTLKGFLPPRMTSAERDAISSPVPAGLRIYNTDTGCENFYNGTSWKQICGECLFGVPDASNSGPLCEGGSATLSASFIPGVDYSWAGPNGFSSSDQNPVISDVSLADAGAYYVTATKDGCTSAASVTHLQISEAPVGGTSLASSTQVCVGVTTTITLSGHTGDIAWQQSSDNIAWVAVSGGSGANTTVYTTPALTEPVYYRALLSVGSCNPSPSTVSGITVNVPSATGGSIAQSGGYAVHTFTSSGTFTPNACLSGVELLLIGGGGGGAGRHGGGGGGGGVLYYGPESPRVDYSYSVNPEVPVNVVVGAGGAGGIDPGGYPNPSNSTQGGNSSFGSVVSVGGGKGGTYNEAGNGGSGGGAGGYNGTANQVNTNFGLGTSGQGNNGGKGVGTSSPFSYPGGGGGGAGAVGGDASGTVAGNGGTGLEYSISGAPLYYGGGGGGAPYNVGTPGTGGAGGGGDGKLGSNGEAGAANTGGGGGGGSEFQIGGGGGSGVVIVRYPNGL